MPSFGGPQEPSWFITGWRQNGDFYVAGSKMLNGGTISSEVRMSLDRDALYDQGRMIQTKSASRYTFSATTYWSDQPHEEGGILAVAMSPDSYTEAIKRLFGVWSPPGGNPLAIGGGG